MNSPPSQSDWPPQGVVAVIRRESRFLVIQRGLKLPRAPGMFCFPGGTIEPGESPLQALHREMREELGVEVEALGKVWASRTPRGVELDWWAAAVSAECSFAPCPYEIAWHGWMDTEEMLGLSQLLPSNQEFIAQLQAGKIVLP